MATTHKFAVVVLEDHGGKFTAMLVDGENNFAAVGRSQDEAVLRVKEAIEAFSTVSGALAPSGSSRGCGTSASGRNGARNWCGNCPT